MSFDAGRLRPADWLLAVAAIALLVILFLVDWYGGAVSGLLPGSHISGASTSATGWQTFTSSRWVWLATILVALGSVLATAVAYRLDGPVQLGALTAGLGAISSALIVYRIAHHPSATVSLGRLHASYGIKIGIWLGLAAALAVTCGGYLQEREEHPPREKRSPREKRRADGGESFSGLLRPPDDAS